MSVTNSGISAFGRNVGVQYGTGVRAEVAGGTAINDLVGGSVEASGGLDRNAVLRMSAGISNEATLGSTGVVGLGDRPADIADWYARGEVSDGAMVPGSFQPATLGSMEAFLDGPSDVRPGCVGVAEVNPDTAMWALGGKQEAIPGGPYNFGDSRIRLDSDF
jgi:hypothetical protein